MARARYGVPWSSSLDVLAPSSEEPSPDTVLTPSQSYVSLPVFGKDFEKYLNSKTSLDLADEIVGNIFAPHYFTAENLP